MAPSRLLGRRYPRNLAGIFHGPRTRLLADVEPLVIVPRSELHPRTPKRQICHGHGVGDSDGSESGLTESQSQICQIGLASSRNPWPDWAEAGCGEAGSDEKAGKTARQARTSTPVTAAVVVTYDDDEFALTACVSTHKKQLYSVNII